MADDWRHPMCVYCWRDYYGKQIPTRIVDPDDEFCCCCRMSTTSGIYVQMDPTHIPYHREH